MNSQFAVDGRVRHAHRIAAFTVDNEIACNGKWIGRVGAEAVVGGQVNGDVTDHTLDD